MSKFKVGDKIKIVNSNYTCDNGTVGLIKDIRNFSNELDMEGAVYWTPESGVELVESNITKTMTNIIDKIKLARKSEPEKTLVKAGLMNMDESLTDEGQKVLSDILIQANKEEMRKVADVILAEEKKEDK